MWRNTWDYKKKVQLQKNTKKKKRNLASSPPINKSNRIYKEMLALKTHLPAGDCAGRDRASAVTRVCGDNTRSTSSVGLRVILSRSFWTATNTIDENNEMK